MKRHHPTVIVVDNFLEDPDATRALALKQEYRQDGSAGKRSAEQFLDIVNADDMETIANIKIDDWKKHIQNGRFQFCTAQDPIVHHADGQRWAGALYLTPDAPVQSGLRLLRSRLNKKQRAETEQDVEVMFGGDFFDSTRWETIDSIGNVYNRLVIWDARHVHAVGCYFGNKIENSRLFQVFFFDSDT